MDARMKTGLRLAGLGAIVGLCVLAWRCGAVQALYWPSLAAHQAQWSSYAASHPAAAPLIYVAIYAAAVALSLPVGLWLSLLSGLLFGITLGTIVTLFGASLGAIALFLLARGLAAPFLNARFGGAIGRLRPGLEQDGFSYLLALRLMPIFPFWLVNLAPALLGMRLAPYAAATVLGMIPTSFMLNAVGAGLATKLAAGGRPSAGMLLAPNVLLPLLGMAVLALLPVVWRRYQARARLRASGPA